MLRYGPSSVHFDTTLHDTCREGQTDKTVAMLNASCPSLPDYVRKAVMELACSKPHFYPMPSWTYLSQLHGPKVGNKG